MRELSIQAERENSELAKEAEKAELEAKAAAEAIASTVQVSLDKKKELERKIREA